MNFGQTFINIDANNNETAFAKVKINERSPEVVYMAHCIPYTYTDLQKYLEGLESDPVLRESFITSSESHDNAFEGDSFP